MANPIRLLQVLGSSRFGGGTAVVFSLIDMAREHGLLARLLSEDDETLEAAGREG